MWIFLLFNSSNENGHIQLPQKLQNSVNCACMIFIKSKISSKHYFADVESSIHQVIKFAKFWNVKIIFKVYLRQ